jgi:hypothetical protein
MKADPTRLNRHAVPHAVSHAKAKYYANICSKIHNMQMDSRSAWEHICILTKDKAGHHSKNITMAMKLTDGTRTTNATENMSVFTPDFQKVFNNHRHTDPSVLDQIPQRRTMWVLNNPITWNEFSQAVCKLKKSKALGLNGVPPEAFHSKQ